MGSHKALVCSSDLEEAGLPGSCPYLPGSQTLPAATRFCSPATSPPPVPPLEELQLGSGGGGWARPWRACGPVLMGDPVAALDPATRWAPPGPESRRSAPCGLSERLTRPRGTSSSSCVLSPYQGAPGRTPKCRFALLLRVQLGPAVSEKDAWNPGHLLLPAVRTPRVPESLEAAAGLCGREGSGASPPAALPFGHHPSRPSPPPSFLLPTAPGAWLCPLLTLLILHPLKARVSVSLAESWVPLTSLSLCLCLSVHTLTVCLHSCPWNLFCS